MSSPVIVYPNLLQGKAFSRLLIVVEWCSSRPRIAVAMIGSANGL
jgi:hypothetical protein